MDITHPVSFSEYRIWRHVVHLSFINRDTFDAPVQGFVQFLQYVTAFSPLQPARRHFNT